MKQYKTVFIEGDDDTYIYGDLDYIVETNGDIQIEPYIMEEYGKVIKFYRKKRFFAIYQNNVLTEIINTMTCWSDDYIAYKLRPDGIAYEYDKNYHGRPEKRNTPCNINLNDFIDINNLRNI